MNYSTPGVKIEEISTLPASVAQVPTAIPAFIGYTAKHLKNGQEIKHMATKITSMLDYVQYFGSGPDNLDIKVDLNASNGVESVQVTPEFYMYDALRMFYANGGGDCYIISVGTYPAPHAKSVTDFYDAAATKPHGIEALRLADEPTLIVIPDMVLLDKADQTTLMGRMLAQCNDLQDRFAILDVKETAPTPGGDTLKEIRMKKDTAALGEFRTHVGSKYLKYGAAYYPFLRTSLPLVFSYRHVKGNVKKSGAATSIAVLSPDKKVIEQYDKVVADLETYIEELVKTPSARFPVPFNGMAAANIRYKKATLSQGYDRIGETNNEEEVRLKVRYIHHMLDKFVNRVKGNLTDDDPGGTIDASTLKETVLNYAPAAATPQADLEKTEIYKVMRPLRIIDELYRRVVRPGGAPATNINEAVLAAGKYLGYTIPMPAGAVGTWNAEFTEYYNSKTDITQALPTLRGKLKQLYQKALAIVLGFHAEALRRESALELELLEDNPVYRNIHSAIKKEGVVVPPSGAMAGIYAQVDNDRGVWKAPANVSLSSVIGPVTPINDKAQEDLNIDVTAGKSINAIRAFAGKGTLVWGARTLAGNDNEWRYVSVRRFYIMVEESVQKSTSWALFEPNDANTWTKVRAQIENFLTGLWRDGALAGSKPDQAFFVRVGLGQTMTQQDILEGKMNVEIGMAAVRPAEFIILKFSHKLQEA